MISNIFVFEDDKYSNFLPLVYLRPVYDLVSGMATLLSKIVRNFPEANISLHCRDYLKDLTKQNHAGIGVNNIISGTGCLIINGRLLAENNLPGKLILDGRNRIFIDDNEEVVAAYLDSEHIYEAKEFFEEVFSSRKFISAFRNKTEITKVKCRLVEYPWELVNESAAQMEADFQKAVPAGIVKGEIHSQAAIIDEYKIYIGQGTKVYPQVVINAERGPIYIGDNCQIKPGTVIEGPAYIGNNCILSKAVILSGTSVGPKSQIKGELSNSILHGYSIVDGSVIRNSYFGDAVDVSNNVFNKTELTPFKEGPDIYIDGYELKTEEKHLGLFAADFARIGQNVLIGPGTVAGICALYETDIEAMPKYLPSFIQQVSSNRFDELSLNEVFEQIRYNLSRKDIEFTKAEEELVEYTFSKFSYDRKISKIIY